MNFIGYYPYHKLVLLSRSEGKIKSFKECPDLRSWSHDIRRRDGYLKEWMKSDMPTCVIPTSSIIDILRRMTCGSKRQVTPRCHPQCKSKVVLESICTSCHAMKECLKNDQNYDKYFEDEEFETSHWPCERCLDALKSIKMFWKIIVEKLFHIDMSKADYSTKSDSCADSIRSVASVWQTDMLDQAIFVKKMTPLLNTKPCTWRGKMNVKRETAPCSLPCADNYDRINDPFKCKSLSYSRSCKMTDTTGLSNSTIGTRKFKTPSSQSRRMSRQTLARVTTRDIACECAPTNVCDENNITFKVKLNNLQQKYRTQREEVEKLKKENGSLRMELQNVYKNSWWRSYLKPVTVGTSRKTLREELPAPYEACINEENNDVNPISAKSIDSEMVITLKKCKDQSYRHISILQVLHKSNSPEINDSCTVNEPSRQQDPIVLLSKVQNRFGAIVRREMNLAANKNCCGSNFDIDATYHNLTTAKSMPTISSTTVTLSSGSNMDVWLTRET